MAEIEEYKEWFRDRDFSSIILRIRHLVSIGGFEYVHHPLGFLMTEILRSESDVLRLHYWRHDLISRGSAITPYHDHIWRLSSCVLFGEIENCILHVSEDPDGGYLLAEVEQMGGIDRVPSQGSMVSFKVKERERVRLGEFYYLPPRIFHFSQMVEGSDALTLVLSEAEVNGSPRTLLPIGSSGHAPERKKVSNSLEINSEILSILEQ
jgi:hypothetical protein